MTPIKKLFLLLLLICTTLSAQAQSGTIKIQHNPGRIDSVIRCGGIWQRSWLVFELTAFQPIDNPAEVFYVPKYYSSKKYFMQNGYGVHIILSSHRTDFIYTKSGAIRLCLVTGFDHYKGKVGDSIFSNGNTYHYNYNFNMIPIHLRLNINFFNRLSSRNFFMSITAEGGSNLLFINFSGTPMDFKETKWVSAFAGGLSFQFLYLRRHTLGLSLKTAFINNRWFREIDLSFPVFYGRYHR